MDVVISNPGVMNRIKLVRLATEPERMNDMSNEKFTKGECPACGIIFERKKETQKYCSQKCTRKMNGKQQRSERWWVNSKGYIEGWCFVNGQWKRKKLHRRVVELHIGRELTLQEDVHHINGDKSDNRIENLMLVEHGKHSIITNNNRQYKSGYKMNISEQERKRRSDWMKSVHLKKHEVKHNAKYSHNISIA